VNWLWLPARAKRGFLQEKKPLPKRRCGTGLRQPSPSYPAERFKNLDRKAVHFMKIVVIKSPKFLSPILRFFFKIKKEEPV
jgi:hypothetical protein